MSGVRKLNAEELKKFVDIVTNAYPGAMKNRTNEFKETLLSRMIERQTEDSSIDFYGVFRENQLLGGMRIHYYQMNLFSKMIPIGGVGQVAVDLLHKKEKVAKELIEAFLNMFLEKGVNIVALYPFRPDFYKKMGFGYGPKIHQYQFTPNSFPNSETKLGVKYLTMADKEEVKQCYTRNVKKTHGMFLKTEVELTAMFNNPDNILVGFEEDHQLKGYILFSFEKRSQTNFVHNDLLIKEFIYESPEAFMQLSNFLHTQADQVNRVIWNTQEENAHFLTDDPRNGSNNLIPSVYHESNTSGVGLMYRIINVKGILEEMKEHNFNQVDTKLKLNLKDTLLPQNNQELILHVKDGWVELVENGDYEVELSLDVSDFSSLLMGVVTFKELYFFGKARLSNNNEWLKMNQLFTVMEKPRCITAF